MINLHMVHSDVCILYWAPVHSEVIVVLTGSSYVTLVLGICLALLGFVLLH